MGVLTADVWELSPFVIGDSDVDFRRLEGACIENISLLYHIVFNAYQRYCDAVMGAMASQITSLTTVYSTVHWGADQRKHQSTASLAVVRGIHRWPVNSLFKWLVTRKCFPLDDVIMNMPCKNVLVDGMQCCEYWWKIDQYPAEHELFSKTWMEFMVYVTYHICNDDSYTFELLSYIIWPSFSSHQSYRLFGNFGSVKSGHWKNHAEIH